MKRLTEKQSRHSLTTQVVIWVVGFVSVLFVTALLIMFHHARESIYQEAMEKARQTLRTTELRIDNNQKSWTACALSCCARIRTY